MTRIALLLSATLAAPALAQQAPTPEQMVGGIVAQARADMAALTAPGAPTLVSIDFAYTVPEAQMRADMTASADLLAVMPGLVWKVWSSAEGTANGTYLFADPEAARFYLDTVFPMGPPKKDGHAEFDISVLSVLEDVSRTTRAVLD